MSCSDYDSLGTYHTMKYTQVHVHLEDNYSEVHIYFTGTRLNLLLHLLVVKLSTSDSKHLNKEPCFAAAVTAYIQYNVSSIHGTIITIINV